MKRMPLLLLALSLCAGCASRYNITLNNGEVITALGKPKYDQARSIYIYKDASGTPSYLPQVDVREIAPRSWKKSEDANDFKFLPAPGAQ